MGRRWNRILTMFLLFQEIRKNPGLFYIGLSSKLYDYTNIGNNFFTLLVPIIFWELLIGPALANKPTFMAIDTFPAYFFLFLDSEDIIYLSNE